MLRRCGDLIYVYGDMDEDGFYTGELGHSGQRGLVPSNFLREVTPDDEKPGPPAGLPVTPQGHGPSPLTVPGTSPRPNRRQLSTDSIGPLPSNPPLVHQQSTTGSHRSSPKSASTQPKSAQHSIGRPSRVSGGSIDSAASMGSGNGAAAAAAAAVAAGSGSGGGGTAGESPPPPLNPDEMPIVLDLTPTPSGKVSKPAGQHKSHHPPGDKRAGAKSSQGGPAAEKAAKAAKAASGAGGKKQAAGKGATAAKGAGKAAKSGAGKSSKS